MIVEPGLGDVPRDPHDGVGPLLVERAELAVHLGGGLLDDAECMNERQRHPLGADPEIFDRALRLRAPMCVG